MLVKSRPLLRSKGDPKEDALPERNSSETPGLNFKDIKENFEINVTFWTATRIKRNSQLIGFFYSYYQTYVAATHIVLLKSMGTANEYVKNISFCVL